MRGRISDGISETSAERSRTMTTARWFSLVTGCLAFFLNYSSEGNPPNFWDFLLVLTYKATAAALIIVPLVLEHIEKNK